MLPTTHRGARAQARALALQAHTHLPLQEDQHPPQPQYPLPNPPPAPPPPTDTQSLIPTHSRTRSLKLAGLLTESLPEHLLKPNDLHSRAEQSALQPHTLSPQLLALLNQALPRTRLIWTHHLSPYLLRRRLALPLSSLLM